ncbi:MAG: hypothetical protein JNJ73_02725 [Hyphomonadaceae bacterium]|nr:hypothetical protein [Hyphomonadaceae bacterium]
MSAAVPDRRAAMAATGLGLATLGVFIGFRTLEPVRAAISSGCGASDTLSRFQLARTMDDLIAVFSAPAGVCRAPIVTAMDAANRLDLYAFIPVYAAFLIAAAIALSGPWRTHVALAAIGAVVLAALGDALETATQLRITQDIEAATPHLPALAIGYWVKNASLGVYAAVIAGVALAPPRRRFALATIAALATLAMVGAAFDEARAPFMTLAFGAFWIALLAIAGQALLPRPATGDAPA